MENIKLSADYESEKILLKAKSKLSVLNETRVKIIFTTYKDKKKLSSEVMTGSFTFKAKENTYVSFKSNRDIMLLYKIE